MNGLLKPQKLQGPSLSKEQWQDFIGRYWDKQGTVLDFTKTPLATPQEAFDLYQAASNYYRTSGSFHDLKFYVDGKQVIQHVKSLLPTADDDCLETYLKHLRSKIGTQDFAVYINGVDKYAYPIWHRVRHFFAGIFDHLKLPEGSLQVELFFGEYSATPGGIHTDGCSNFHSVIVGEKTFYVWPSDMPMDDAPVKQDHSQVTEENFLDSKDINWQLDHRQDLTAKSGQMIFCPHDWWHVAKTQGLCLCINVGLYPKGRARTLYFNALQEHFFSAESEPVYSHEKELIECFEQPSQNLKDYISSKQLQDTLKKLHINYQQTSAMSALPAMKEDFNLPADDVNFHMHQDAKVDHWKDSNDQTVISVNGYLFETKHEKEALWLLQQLNDYQPQNIQTLMAHSRQGNKEVDTEVLRDLIGRLIKRHALVELVS